MVIGLLVGLFLEIFNNSAVFPFLFPLGDNGPYFSAVVLGEYLLDHVYEVALQIFGLGKNLGIRVIVYFAILPAELDVVQDLLHVFVFLLVVLPSYKI